MQNFRTKNAVTHSFSGKIGRTLILLGIFWLQVLPSAAQNPARIGDQLGVLEAIERAYQQNPMLNDLQAQIQGKKGMWWNAFGIHAPMFSYMKEGIDDGLFMEQRWGITQILDFPLTSFYRLKQTSTEQDAMILALESERKRVKAAVKTAYTELLYTQELMHMRGEEVRLAEELIEVANVRVEAGEASELEQIKAEIQLAEAQSGQEEALRQFQNARYNLFNVVGLDPDDQSYTISFPDTLVYISTDIDQTDVLNRIGVQPALQSASRFVDAAQLGLKQTRSSLLPTLQFDLFTQDFGFGYNQFGFQIGLRVPLWLVPNHRGSVQTAQAELQSRTWKQRAIYLDLKKQVEQAWHNYETSRIGIERYNTIVRARTTELLAQTQEGYRIGELNLLTLLDAQRTYLASELRFYNTLRHYYIQLINLEQFLNEDIVFTSPE
jgi:cobalt-zinc-cadmium efflux system outer membrane protein